MMARKTRTVLGVTYTSLAFGIVFAPYVYLAFGVSSHLVPPLAPLVVSILVAATVLLLLSFTTKSKLEERLEKSVGRLFQALAITVTCLAFACLCVVLALLANFGLPEAEQYWFSLILIVGITTLIALPVILFTPPSRLEQLISAKTSRSDGAHVAYQTVGYTLLALGVLFVYIKLHQYYVFSHPVY